MDMAWTWVVCCDRQKEGQLCALCAQVDLARNGCVSGARLWLTAQERAQLCPEPQPPHAVCAALVVGALVGRGEVHLLSMWLIAREKETRVFRRDGMGATTPTNRLACHVQ